MKSKIFVASSVEGLDIAYSIQTNLQHEADITVWPQDVFSLSITSLDSLTGVLDNSDFGIFVFSPDDEIKMRNATNNTVRDNVIFELGLFIGRLGKQRCYIVAPDKIDFHIPTDLIGLTPATYSNDRDISEISASLGPACHSIRKEIKKYGSFRKDNKIPINEHDNFDENDKITILESWLETNKNHRMVLKYKDIDNELKLEFGTTKKYLSDIISKNSEYSLKSSGGTVFRFSYEPYFSLTI